MLYRKYYLQDNFTLNDSGTRTVDVNVQDPVTCLWVKFQATNGGTSNKVADLGKCISAIELIDGADILFSLDGPEAFALAAYQLGQMQDNIIDESGGDPQTYVVPIMFGRYMGDKELALDPRKFANPQLRFQWNLAAVRAVGATGFATGTLQLSVVADVMQGAPEPRGFLMHKEVYSWTSAAAGWEYIDLPTDYPYRGVMLRCVKAETDWHWIADQVRMNCDGGQFIAMNLRGWDITQMLNGYSPIFHYTHVLRVTNNDRKQFLLRINENVEFQPDGVGDLVTSYSGGGNGEGTIGTLIGGAAAGDNRKIRADIMGKGPCDCVYLPFGRQDQSEDWFPAPDFKGIQFEVRGGVADGSDYLVLTQERTY